MPDFRLNVLSAAAQKSVFALYGSYLSPNGLNKPFLNF